VITGSNLLHVEQVNVLKMAIAVRPNRQLKIFIAKDYFKHLLVPTVTQFLD
jgi:hypothetical protein